MSMRKIKNAVNNTTGELIYFKGHAKATFMSDGSTVEDAIKNIKPNIDLSDYVKSEELEGYAKTEDIPSLEGYAKSEDIPSLDGYAKTEDIPSLDGYVQSSELPNFDEFAKTDDIPSLEGYAKEEDIPSLYGYATQQWVNEQEFAHQDDLLNMSFNDIQDSPITENNDGEVNIVDENGNIALKVNDEGLYVKNVIAGDHVLSNKADTSYVDEEIAKIVDGAPETLDTLNELSAALKDNADIVDVLNQSIGSKQDTITDLETIRQGAAKGATALQSYTEQYKGTVTGVKINGTTKNPSNGVVDLGTVITSHQDISGKQDSLVSGTNIKTINGQSILGSGNIVISGGNSDANVAAVDTGDVLDDVNLSYATIAYVDGLIGDINSVLESIINGLETNEVTVNIIDSYKAAPVYKTYDVICVLSKPLDVKQTATLYYLDGENQPQELSLVVESGQTEFIFEEVMIQHTEPDMYSVVIGEIEEEDANGIKVTLRSNFKFKYVYS